MNKNILANIFDWLGDALERFNPSAYKFLAAVLPYLTPIPVAWLTSASASEFLQLPPQIAFILVFALEGIGLWFTSLLVDAVVDWIKSRNLKTFALVVMFGVVVAIYITILVNLNVTLEQAKNSGANPALSRVITLMCFLPLLTGVGNGYYKIKLDAKKQADDNLNYERSRKEKEWEANRSDRMERYKLKHSTANGSERTMNTNELSTVRTTVRKSKRTGSTNERSRTNGELRTFVLEQFDVYERTNRSVAGVGEIARTVAQTVNAQNGQPDSYEGYERYKGYVSDLRKVWLQSHPEYQ
jgi:hypothetical protein